ncbi:MAG TPA: mercuric transporter MerT family protein [Thermoanaerobaculia bacterium]|nr:mercuric transporter MerT family protein [Thermoanaerobaculia bacterium]
MSDPVAPEKGSAARAASGPRLAGGGALAAALAYFLTALCCLPVALGATGAALAGVAGFLGPYQPLLAGIALLLLAVAFYRAYRRPTVCVAGQCPPARSRAALWFFAVAVLLLLTARFWISRLL